VILNLVIGNTIIGYGINRHADYKQPKHSHRSNQQISYY